MLQDLYSILEEFSNSEFGQIILSSLGKFSKLVLAILIIWAVLIVFKIYLFHGLVFSRPRLTHYDYKPQRLHMKRLGFILIPWKKTFSIVSRQFNFCLKLKCNHAIRGYDILNYATFEGRKDILFRRELSGDGYKPLNPYLHSIVPGRITFYFKTFDNDHLCLEGLNEPY